MTTTTTKKWSEVRREHAASIMRWSILRGAACACVWSLGGVRAATVERETFVHWAALAGFAIVYVVARYMVGRRVAEVADRCDQCGANCFVCAVRNDGNAGKSLRVQINESEEP